MGKRGPKPTPKEILALRGSRRGKRSGNEPIVDRTVPEQPEWLDETARQCWDELVPQLTEMGVLARIDGNAVARYCTLWSRWRTAEDFLSQYGTNYPLKDKNGQIKCFQQFPQVAIAHRLSLALSKIEAELGMTPSSRSRIVVKPSEAPKNAILEFLNSKDA